MSAGAGRGGGVIGTIPLPATVKEGAKGQAVRNAQGLLLAHGADPQGLDGSFGSRTTSAVRAFQKARKLAADGVIGPDTWTALVTS